MYDCSQVEEEEANLDRSCQGFNGYMKPLSWKEKEKLIFIHINTPTRRRNLIRSTRLIGRKPLKSLC